MISILVITKGITLYNMNVKLQFLLSAHHLMMLYICTRSGKSILNGFKV